MKLVSVEELQNDTLFVSLCLILIVVNTNTNKYKYKNINTNTNTFKVTVYQHLFLCEVNLTRYGACTKQLARKKGYHFVALLKLYLLILVSLKLEFAKLLTLEFSFHYCSLPTGKKKNNKTKKKKKTRTVPRRRL